MSDVIKKAIFGYAELGKKEDSLGVKAIEQYNQLLETADRRLALLKVVEWTSVDISDAVDRDIVVWQKCPICDAWFDDGHSPNCELAEELE